MGIQKNASPPQALSLLPLLPTPQPQLHSPLPLEFLLSLLPGLPASPLSPLSLQPSSHRALVGALSRVGLPLPLLGALLSGPSAPQPGVHGPVSVPPCASLASHNPGFLSTVPATPSCWQLDGLAVLSLVPGILRMLFPLAGTLFLASSALGSSPSNICQSRLPGEAATQVPQMWLMLIQAPRVPPQL